MPGKQDQELDDFDSFNDLNDAGGKEVKLPEPKNDASDDSDDIAVEIVDDTPEEDRGFKPRKKQVADPTDEELQNYGERARTRISELTNARHEERRRAEAAARERDAAVQTAQALLRRTQEYEQLIQNGTKEFTKVSTEAAEAAVAAAKAKLKKAKDDYDTEAEVEALAELNSAQLRLENAKNFKLPPSQPEKDAVQPRQSTEEPAPRLDPKTAAWMRRNTWFDDPEHSEVKAYALGVHQKLVNAGYDPRSDEYFDEIDARLKKVFPEVVGAADDEPRENRRSDPPPRRSVVAPASRTTGPKKITLTASQVSIARSLGLTPQQYAAQLIKEAKNG